MSNDDDIRIRPGRIRPTRSPPSKRFVAQALKAAEKAGGMSRRRAPSGTGGSAFGRGRSAALRAGNGVGRHTRNVTVKARIVRQRGVRGKLAAHLLYLRRDGVTRDGSPGQLFDAVNDDANHDAFAERCHDDRHHFRFIVSPEDAPELSDLRGFTRDLMATAEKDLGTMLDWVGVDHWNTEHPHIHVLVRGKAKQGDDLVISRDYIGHGLRARARERATLELGPRSELEIARSCEREVEAERWTGLDRTLSREATDGRIDLRPRFGEGTDADRNRQIARMRKLERLGIAQPTGPGQWHLPDTAKPRLDKLQMRGDIVKRLHNAMTKTGTERSAANFVLDGAREQSPILGRLAARGLDNELTGSAFVVIDGVDGRAHHVRLPDLESASDAPVGGIVEARWTRAAKGYKSRLLIAVRSDLGLDRQVSADGATWLDGQLVSRSPASRSANGFGAEVSDAMQRRADYLVETGLAERRNGRLFFSRNMLASLRKRELDGVARSIAAETGLAHNLVAEGETVSGTVRRRLALASGRFAVIDNGMGFQLVPWADPLEKRRGQHISGIVRSGGGIDWNLGRKRGLSI